MSVSLKGRSLLTLLDFSSEEIRYLLDLSHDVKKEKKSGIMYQRFIGKTIALIFEKRSTRTRCAFQTAFGEEGGFPVFLSPQDIHLGAKESIEDTARVLGRMFDAIQFRGYKQNTVEMLAKHSGVPVYNGLTDNYHPTQALADLMTIEEEFGSLEGKKCIFIGDGRNNVSRSLMIGCARMGVHYTVISPRELFPESEFIDLVKSIALTSGSEIVVTDAIQTAGADVIYTDVWISMGEEDKVVERMKMLEPYRVNNTLMQGTGKSGSIFLHCLPAVKGNEVTSEVFEGASSRVFDQAENRKHTIKALMLATI